MFILSLNPFATAAEIKVLPPRDASWRLVWADEFDRDGPPINPFQAPHRLRLNLAIGSSGGDPSNTRFPQRYEVDCVQIYQKRPDAR